VRATKGPSEQQLQLRRQIEKTRRELGQTVEALVNKADVEKRVDDKVHQGASALEARGRQLKDRVTDVGHKTERTITQEPVRDVVDRAVRRLADHPVVPAGAVVAVTGWIIAQGRRR